MALSLSPATSSSVFQSIISVSSFSSLFNFRSEGKNFLFRHMSLCLSVVLKTEIAFWISYINFVSNDSCVFVKFVRRIDVLVISNSRLRKWVMFATKIWFSIFYLNINQLDALNFIMNLFHASTYFEHKCSSSGGQNCAIQSLVSSHL